MWFWLFLLSVFINIFLMFYVKWLFKVLENINSDMSDLKEKIDAFSAHLLSLHDMEMFYGDQTLQSLMQHAAQLSSDILNLDLLLNTVDDTAGGLNEKEESGESLREESGFEEKEKA